MKGHYTQRKARRHGRRQQARVREQRAFERRLREHVRRLERERIRRYQDDMADATAYALAAWTVRT